MNDWLDETRQLDLSHPKLRITAQKLTQSKQCLHARAAAIHDFVRRMPFSAGAHDPRVRASDVLARGGGDCHTKGLLFTALCRAADLPARLLFVRVRPQFLAGVIEGATETIVHAVGQVRIGERWASTDAYVVDPVMFALAKQALRREGWPIGWGIAADAPAQWDGRSTCIQQFRTQDLVATIGVYSDLDEYRRSQGAQPHPWVHAVKHAVGARLVNWRVAQLRRARSRHLLAPSA